MSCIIFLAMFSSIYSICAMSVPIQSMQRDNGYSFNNAVEYLPSDNQNDPNYNPPPENELTPSEYQQEDVDWRKQMSQYAAYGMQEKDVIREHKAYVRQVNMLKTLARKCVKAMEYMLT